VIAVYVPAGEPDFAWRVGAGPRHARSIKPGSGIVGQSVLEGQMIELYFEGNLYGAVNLDRFAQRVRQAAGRMEQSYPTIARMHVKPEDVIQVGWFDADQGVVVVMPGGDAARMLASWLDVDVNELHKELIA